MGSGVSVEAGRTCAVPLAAAGMRPPPSLPGQVAVRRQAPCYGFSEPRAAAPASLQTRL